MMNFWWIVRRRPWLVIATTPCAREGRLLGTDAAPASEAGASRHTTEAFERARLELAARLHTKRPTT